MSMRAKAIILVALSTGWLLAACAGDSPAIIDSAVATIQAQFGGAGPTSATNPEPTVSDLQARLMELYQIALPSVVYIVTPSGSGSGFVYDNQGHIVTNNHVIAEGGPFLTVFSNDDQQYAELVGADIDGDLAVLQVENLPDQAEPLPLAQPQSLAVGQIVVAIGSPFGEQGSMSMGIISGLGRSLSSQRVLDSGAFYSLPHVIQTDAPINPGNSGGPLVNFAGQVVGVNSAIASTSGVGSGVGFAVPVEALRRIIPALIDDGEFTYSYMGASFDEEVTLDEVDTYGLSQTQGAYVISVEEGGPAEQAGLVGANLQTGMGGDLVIQIDGQSIHDFEDLNGYLVFQTSPGQTIEVTVLRDGEQVTFPVTLQSRP